MGTSSKHGKCLKSFRDKLPFGNTAPDVNLLPELLLDRAGVLVVQQGLAEVPSVCAIKAEFLGPQLLGSAWQLCLRGKGKQGMHISETFDYSKVGGFQRKVCQFEGFFKAKSMLTSRRFSVVLPHRQSCHLHTYLPTPS